MKQIISFIIVIFLLTGCHQFLEPQSQSEFVPKTAKALNELLLGEAYMGPRDAGMFGILGLFDDDVTTRPLNFDDEEENAIEQIKYAFTWSKDMYNYSDSYNIYGPVYERIVGCNAALDLLEEVSGQPVEKTSVKAQALAMRAFYYFHLVNLYGKPYSVQPDSPGVPLKITSALSSNTLRRNTVREVYQQILQDLSEAEQLYLTLPLSDQWQADGRASLPMVQLMLSRVYLYMENWEQTLKYAGKVIENPQFSLLDLQTRTIPAYQYTAFQTYYLYSNPEVIFLYGQEADVVHLPNTSRIRLKPGENASRGFICVASEELVKTFGEKDLRKSHYLASEYFRGTPQKFYIPYGKYESTLDFEFSINTLGGQWGAALKLTEAYLNAAEGAARLYLQNNQGEYRTQALERINQLRRYRFAEEDYTEENPVSAKDLLKLVSDERRRELCFENHRWFDLRRYGMEKITHIWNPKNGVNEKYILEKNDPGFTLLIPKEAIALNPALEQNPSR